MGLLLPAEGALRGLQAIFSILFIALWAWMHSQGFLQGWDTAPPGAPQYGAVAFTLGMVAGIHSLLFSIIHIVLMARRSHGQGKIFVHIGRTVADVATLGLFVGVRIILALTPGSFQDLLLPSNPKTAREFFSISKIATAGSVILIVLHVLTIPFAIYEAVSARKMRRQSAFGRLEENPNTGMPYAQQNYSRGGFVQTQEQAYGTPAEIVGGGQHVTWGGGHHAQRPSFSIVQQPPPPPPSMYGPQSSYQPGLAPHGYVEQHPLHNYGGQPYGSTAYAAGSGGHPAISSPMLPAKPSYSGF